MTLTLLLEDGWGARVYQCGECGDKFTELNPDWKVVKCAECGAKA